MTKFPQLVDVVIHIEPPPHSGFGTPGFGTRERFRFREARIPDSAVEQFAEPRTMESRIRIPSPGYFGR